MAETSRQADVILLTTASRGSTRACCRVTLGLRVLFVWIAAVLAVHSFTRNAIGQDKKESVVNVDSRHNGGSASLPVGGRLVITLQAQPGTGYGWHVTSAPSRFLQLQSNVFRPGGGLPGGTENQVLTFLAREAGKTVLVLSYRGPGDTTAPAVKQFQLAVTVARP